MFVQCWGYGVGGSKLELFKGGLTGEIWRGWGEIGRNSGNDGLKGTLTVATGWRGSEWVMMNGKFDIEWVTSIEFDWKFWSFDLDIWFSAVIVGEMTKQSRIVTCSLFRDNSRPESINNRCLEKDIELNSTCLGRVYIPKFDILRSGMMCGVDTPQWLGYWIYFLCDSPDISIWLSSH